MAPYAVLERWYVAAAESLLLTLGVEAPDIAANGALGVEDPEIAAKDAGSSRW